MTEITIAAASLPLPKKRPTVPGIKVGEPVVGRLGRPMKVLSVDEWVVVGDRATGPYCSLTPTDGKQVAGPFIWPRSWYSKIGENLQLEFA